MSQVLENNLNNRRKKKQRPDKHPSQRQENNIDSQQHFRCEQQQDTYDYLANPIIDTQTYEQQQTQIKNAYPQQIQQPDGLAYQDVPIKQRIVVSAQPKKESKLQIVVSPYKKSNQKINFYYTDEEGNQQEKESNLYLKSNRISSILKDTLGQIYPDPNEFKDKKNGKFTYKNILQKIQVEKLQFTEQLEDTERLKQYLKEKEDIAERLQYELFFSKFFYALEKLRQGKDPENIIKRLNNNRKNVKIPEGWKYLGVFRYIDKNRAKKDINDIRIIKKEDLANNIGEYFDKQYFEEKFAIKRSSDRDKEMMN